MSSATDAAAHTHTHIHPHTQIQMHIVGDRDFAVVALSLVCNLSPNRKIRRTKGKCNFPNGRG